MFENEYTMDSKRYCKWMVPICYKLPIFYVWLGVFIVSTIGLIYFKTHEMVNANRWITVAVFLMFISFYRAIPRRWMVANKQYRLMKQKYFNDKDWQCKNVITNRYIELYLNGKQNNTVGWDEIKEFREAKTYFNLSTGNGREGVMLDKECFTKGNVVDFKEYMKREHSDIPYKQEEPAYNK